MDLNDRLRAGEKLADLIANAVCDLDAGRAALDELVATVRAAATKQGRLDPIVAFYADPRREDVEALAAVDPTAIEAAIAALASQPGTDTQANRLRKHLFEAAKALQTSERAAHLRVVRRQDPIHVDHELPDLITPAGWSLQGDGLFVHNETPAGDVKTARVAKRPPLITGLLRSIDDDTIRACVEWPQHRGPWHRTIVPREVLASREVVSLASQGADVGAHNARDLTRWFADLENANGKTLPHALLTTRLGWVGDTPGPLGFLVGHRVVGGTAISPDDSPTTWAEDAVQLAASEGREQDAEGYTASGTLDGWKEAVAPALAYPSPALALYAALATPLIAIIPGAPNAVLDWSGHTSRGKTTTLRLAASVWGKPAKVGEGGIVHSWNGSFAQLESSAGFALDLPIFLDETQEVAEKEHELIGRFIYGYANASGKGRGMAEGGHRRTATFRGIVLSTGEAPLTSFGQASGARARTLCFRGFPFDDEHKADLVDTLIADLEDHHGHAGPAVVESLVRHRDHWPRLQAMYAEHRARYQADTQDAVAKRLARVLALLELGAHLAHKTLGLPIPERDPLEIAWEVAHESARAADQPAEALRRVYEWATQHPGDFWGRHEEDSRGIPRRPHLGWAGSWKDGQLWTEIAFHPMALARILRHQGFRVADEAINAWVERGWVDVDGRHYGKKRRIEGESVRLVCLTRDALEQVGAL